MDVIRRQYYRFLLIFMILLCSLCIGLSFWSLKDAETVHAGQTYQQLYAIKKTFLKDTVQNLIRDIDRLRAFNRDFAKAHIEEIGSDLKQLYKSEGRDIAESGLELLRRKAYSESLNILFEDSRSVLFKTGAKGKTEYSSDLRFGNYRLRLGINEEWVDSETKKSVAFIIHSQVFVDDGYIWVNEVRNWEGGDNYAVRLIHPNLVETEGSLLSTNTKDIKGNTPYLTELEGVRTSGEIYYTYFFQRKNSLEIAEKLSYATLYKDYNWIIAMGMYLEDVRVYIDEVQNASHLLTTRLILIASVLLCVLFFAGILVLSRMEKWYLQRARHSIREESNTDHLTGALNRRMGEVYLNEAFKRYHRGLENPAFLSFDIDNFKKVNDTYGHDAGDKVLKAIVDQIFQNLRNTDRLFRWGGEEFLLLCYGVDRVSALALAGKLNKTIALTPMVIGHTDAPPTCKFDLESCAFLACDNQDPFNSLCITRDGEMVIHVSVSIGVSWFSKKDSDPSDVVKRVDQAMYQAKADGKNCARLA